MNAKPKRRWYQFSIRLLLAVTFASSLPLARIAYLQQMITFHESEQRRYISELAKLNGYSRLAKSDSLEAIAAFLSDKLGRLAEGSETVNLGLDSPAGTALGPASAVSATILDND